MYQRLHQRRKLAAPQQAHTSAQWPADWKCRCFIAKYCTDPKANPRPLRGSGDRDATQSPAARLSRTNAHPSTMVMSWAYERACAWHPSGALRATCLVASRPDHGRARCDRMRLPCTVRAALAGDKMHGAAAAAGLAPAPVDAASHTVGHTRACRPVPRMVRHDMGKAVRRHGSALTTRAIRDARAPHAGPAANPAAPQASRMRG
eukprot:329677-Chlamydomonas_euryale.AAC.6